MNSFAYTVKAELNNDGSYRVTLFDVDEYEAPITETIERARIIIEPLCEDDGDSVTPLLTMTVNESRLL